MIENIQTIGSWASIICLVITLFTLMLTLNIRGKIERSLGKQRFLQQREKIVADFAALRAKIKALDKPDSEALEELRVLLLQLTHFKIWHLKESAYFKRFIAFLTNVYNGKKQTTCKELVMRIDEVVTIVKSQVEV